MPKKVEIQEAPFGMCSDPNVLKAPLGALKMVDNGVIRRHGVIEPRRGVDKVSVSGTNLNYVTRMFNYDSDLLLYDTRSTELFEFLGNLGNSLQDEDGGYPIFFDNYYNVVKARDNLYVACDDGVRKVTSSASTDLFVAGINGEVYPFEIEYTSPTTGTTWWTTATALAMKATLAREDDNGLIVESYPSYRVIGYNADPADRMPRIRVYIGDGVQAGDIIKIYSTIMASTVGTLTDSYYYAAQITVTSSHVSTGYANIYVTRSQDSFGESLYTNSEQQGPEGANYRPPVSKNIIVHNGSNIYSNVIEPTRVAFDFVPSYTDLAGIDGVAGVRQLTGNSTNGNPTITGVSSLVGVKVGQYICGTNIPDGTYVISISAPDLTMSKNATGTAAISFATKDTITFGTGSVNETYICGKEADATSTTHNLIRLSVNMAEYDSVYNVIVTDDVYSYVNSVVIEKRLLNSGNFYVWATNGVSPTSYSVTLSGPTWSGSAFVFSTANGYISKTTTTPNGYYYSKTDQPESVPLGNSGYIGDTTDIVASVDTIDGVMFFKDDGIYLLSGDAENGFTSRKVDNDNILVTSNAAIRVGDGVFALTNNGLIRVTAYGVEYLSRNYLDHRVAEGMQVDQAGSLTKLLADLIQARRDGTKVSACWVVYDKKDNQIYFTVPYWNYEAHYVYVYNLVTLAFTRWDYDDTSLYYMITYDGESNKLYKAGSNLAESGLLYKDNGIYGANYTRSRNISAKPDAVTIDFTAAHNAAVNDVVTDGTYRGIISAIVDADTVTVDTNVGLTGAVVIYTPFPVSVRWMPKFGETRALRKNFVAYEFTFDSIGALPDSRGVLQYYEVSFMGDDYPHLGGYSATYYGPHAVEGSTVRGLVPVEYARKFTLEPAIRIKSANILWSLVGMSLEYYLQAFRGAR